MAARYDQGETDRAAAAPSSTNEFTGIGFNFSQYIQDNVEEGLSGVKGANSVKIIGPDLASSEQIARPGHERNGQVRRRHRPGHVLRCLVSPI